MFDELTLTTVAYTLVEMFKMAGLPTKFAPLASVIVGITFAVVTGMHWGVGLFAGLSASGIYAGVKKVAK